jgi:hypothetical protein
VIATQRIRQIAFGELPTAAAGGDEAYERTVQLRDELDRHLSHLERTALSGVYAVTVSPSISDDPVRWLFVDEGDADLFAAAINGDSEFPEATVSYEPIAFSLDDEHLRETFPEETTEARRLARA